MDGSKGGRGNNARRNDSISSVMSFTAENPTWSRQNEENKTGNPPATPRDAHANGSQGYHALNGTDANGHALVLSSDSDDQAMSIDSSSSESEESDDLTTEQDIRNWLFERLDEMTNYPDMDLVHPYQRAELMPPVTHYSLAELDVPRIVNNPRLRHDVNFDRELHFRPNTDGKRGKQKLRDADQYWMALIGELELYKSIAMRILTSKNPAEMEHWHRMMQASQRRVPGMFETIREVLKTLVPERDQAIVVERFDEAMIMQQIGAGVFDLMGLAQWLSTLLKIHCAPMRDESIDSMVETMRKGVQEGCQKSVVEGLKQILSILEWMKLDVANHQIRNLRHLLIDDTVNFQQKYHLHRLNYGRMDATRARMWFRREAAHLNAVNLSPTPLEIFSSATLRSLLSQSPMSAFPETFHLDSERLRVLRSDLHEIIQLNICCDTFELLARGRINERIYKSVRSSLKSIISDIVGKSRRFVENAGNIAAEIVRMVLQLEGAEISYNTDLMEYVERQLSTDLQVSSVAFSTQIQEILEENLPKFAEAVKINSKISLLALHDAMLPRPSTTGRGPATQTQPEQPIDEILRRATHMAVLHWHIWSPIVYNIQDDGHFSRPGSAGNSSDPSRMGTGPPAPPASDMQAQGRSAGFANQPSGSSIF